MAAVTSVGETPAPAAASRPRGMHAGRRRRLNIFRYVVFTVFGLFFLLPLLAMLRFSLEGTKLGTWSLTAWKEIASMLRLGVKRLTSRAINRPSRSRALPIRAYLSARTRMVLG